jgi:hypothetical protein
MVSVFEANESNGFVHQSAEIPKRTLIFVWCRRTEQTRHEVAP